MFRAFQINNSSLARWWRRRASRHVSSQSPVILGGCPRSGTTLLRVMLDSHPRIVCGPETSLFTGGFIPHKLAARFDMSEPEIWALHDQAGDHAQFVERFFSRYAERRGRSRWADKTPQNIRHLDYIYRHFPEARFVHVIRDGRDVVCSMRTHPKFRVVNGQPVETNIRRPLRPCIEMWLEDTGCGMAWRGRSKYFELRYEDLVGAPEKTLRSLCEYLGETFDGAMLEYHARHDSSRDAARFAANEAATQPLSKESIGRWRNDLTDDEQKLFAQLAGHRLCELGYGNDSSSSASQPGTAGKQPPHNAAGKPALATPRTPL